MSSNENKKESGYYGGVAFAAEVLSTAGTLTKTNSGSALKGYYLNNIKDWHKESAIKKYSIEFVRLCGNLCSLFIRELLQKTSNAMAICGKSMTKLIKDNSENI